jgi:ABC-type dipeptide/oligopeptide/nickel transport system permease subunit
MRPTGRRLLTVGGVLLAAVVLATLAAPWLAPFDPVAQGVGPRTAPPDGEHWLGTDRFGRDTASRVLHGGRNTLLQTGATMLAVIASVRRSAPRSASPGPGWTTSAAG